MTRTSPARQDTLFGGAYFAEAELTLENPLGTHLGFHPWGHKEYRLAMRQNPDGYVRNGEGYAGKKARILEMIRAADVYQERAVGNQRVLEPVIAQYDQDTEGLGCLARSQSEVAETIGSYLGVAVATAAYRRNQPYAGEAVALHDGLSHEFVGRATLFAALNEQERFTGWQSRRDEVDRTAMELGIRF